MTVQTIRINPNSTVESALLQQKSWLRTLSSEDIVFLTREINDLIVNGSLIFSQAGSFKSKRTVQIADQQVLIVADFTQPGVLRKLLLKWTRN